LEQTFTITLLSVRSVCAFWNTRLAGEQTQTHMLFLFALSRLGMDITMVQEIGTNFGNIYSFGI